MTTTGIGRKAHGKFGEKLTLAVVLLQQLGADIAFVKVSTDESFHSVLYALLHTNSWTQIIGTVLEPVVAKISGPMSNVYVLGTLFLSILEQTNIKLC